MDVLFKGAGLGAISEASRAKLRGALEAHEKISIEVRVCAAMALK